MQLITIGRGATPSHYYKKRKRVTVMMTRFYKVLVISIDVFASKIIDERHFPDYIHATSYADAMKKQCYAAVIVQM